MTQRITKFWTCNFPQDWLEIHRRIVVLNNLSSCVGLIDHSHVQGLFLVHVEWSYFRSLTRTFFIFYMYFPSTTIDVLFTASTVFNTTP